MSRKPPKWLVSNEDIGALILAWAKQHHPGWYEQTLKVAHIPETFRRYMIRLIEIRVHDEGPQAVKNVPVSVLDESKLVVTLVGPDGQHYEFCGALAQPKTPYRFWELAMPPADFALWQQAKQSLDLESIHERE